LKILRLRPHQSATSYNYLNIVDLLEAIPNIAFLSISDWPLSSSTGIFDFTHLEGLSRLELNGVCLKKIPRLPSSITHLLLNRNVELKAEEDEEFMLPLLETFSCEDTQLEAHSIKAITTSSIKAGNLKSLFVGHRAIDLSGPTDLGYPHSETVEELSLAHLWTSEKELLTIIDLYPNLRRIDISNTKITGVGVKHLISMGIKWLNLNECSHISPDAIEYARGKGVEVLFNFPSRQNGNRGFRDLSFAGAF